jgi:hypothetical protein
MADEDDRMVTMRVVPEEDPDGIRGVRIYVEAQRQKPVDFLIEEDDSDVRDMWEIFTWLARANPGDLDGDPEDSPF